MENSEEERGFASWLQAFRENKLKPDQLAVLQEIVDKGKVDTLERAAQLLDWHETMVDRQSTCMDFDINIVTIVYFGN